MTQEQSLRDTRVGTAFANVRRLIEFWGWGCHCAPDAYYAHIINATKEYLARQPDGYEGRSLSDVEKSHWKLLAVWFANGREDLQHNLFSKDDIEAETKNKTFCWQDFGFPPGIVEEVKKDITTVEEQLVKDGL